MCSNRVGVNITNDMTLTVEPRREERKGKGLKAETKQ